jgi:calcium-dependent protein kinase
LERLVQNDRHRQQWNNNFDELEDDLKMSSSELMESEIKDTMDAVRELAQVLSSFFFPTIQLIWNWTIACFVGVFGRLILTTVEQLIVVNFTWINWREENLASAFSFFDKDGSGYISIDELQQAYEELGLM